MRTGESPLVPRPVAVEPGTGSWVLPAQGRGTVVEVTVAPEAFGAGVPGAEGFRLIIGPSGPQIEAAGPAGFFHGRTTLEQLEFHHRTTGSVPVQILTDGPRFPHRGFMLDCARHWFPASEVMRVIELASRLHLNVFHWHLTDDQGWRIPVPRWPELTRRAPAYTSEEIRAVVAFASARHVTVIPEIDLPGHSTAVLAAYPELGCRRRALSVPSDPGIYLDILCPGRDRTLGFLTDVLDEVAALFPGPAVHLGGDEAPKDRWCRCPDCQARIRNEGLAGEEELQGWLTNRLAAHLARAGKTAVVWNESLNSGLLDPSATVQFWMENPDRGRTAAWAEAGGRVIVSDRRNHYLDYPEALTPLSESWKPGAWFDGLSDRARASVVGFEAPLWTEFVADRTGIDRQLFPRLAAVAETAWSLAAGRQWEDFLGRFSGLHAWLESLGVACVDLKDAEPDRRLASTKRQARRFYFRLVANPRILAFLVSRLWAPRPRRRPDAGA